LSALRQTIRPLTVSCRASPFCGCSGRSRHNRRRRPESGCESPGSQARTRRQHGPIEPRPTEGSERPGPNGEYEPEGTLSHRCPSYLAGWGNHAGENDHLAHQVAKIECVLARFYNSPACRSSLAAGWCGFLAGGRPAGGRLAGPCASPFAAPRVAAPCPPTPYAGPGRPGPLPTGPCRLDLFWNLASASSPALPLMYSSKP